ncbi:hypothetical protein VTI74DRAFT_6021 [Chaetomium olivicolor]
METSLHGHSQAHRTPATQQSRFRQEVVCLPSCPGGQETQEPTQDGQSGTLCEPSNTSIGRETAVKLSIAARRHIRCCPKATVCDALGFRQLSDGDDGPTRHRKKKKKERKEKKRQIMEDHREVLLSVIVGSEKDKLGLKRLFFTLSSSSYLCGRGVRPENPCLHPSIRLAGPLLGQICTATSVCLPILRISSKIAM